MHALTMRLHISHVLKRVEIYRSIDLPRKLCAIGRLGRGVIQSTHDGLSVQKYRVRSPYRLCPDHGSSLSRWRVVKFPRN